MARIRTIKPEFPHSESMGRISRDSRLLFILLWTLADDSGRLRGNSRMLASLLFPYDDDAPKKIDGWMSELERENCIVRYSHEGHSYLEICNWLEHQKIDKPSESKLPAFANVREDSPKIREDSSLDQDQGPRTKEGTKDHICSEPEEPASEPVVAMSFPVVGDRRNPEWPLPQPKVDEYRDTFPGLDVDAELRKVRQWCIDNPTKRKTARGMPRFLFAWLERKQNQQGNGQHSRYQSKLEQADAENEEINRRIQKQLEAIR